MITDKFLFEDGENDRKSIGSIGSDEAVLFLNPNNYTLEIDDLDAEYEVSAFDADVIEEENDAMLNDKLLKGKRDQLYSAIKSGRHQLDEAHMKAELCIGFKDKKQIKKNQK